MTPVRGTGVGLATTKIIVERNGGKISFVSEEGTHGRWSFVFRLLPHHWCPSNRLKHSPPRPARSPPEQCVLVVLIHFVSLLGVPPCQLAPLFLGAGVGTTFTFTMPLRRTNPAHRSGHSPAASSSKTDSNFGSNPNVFGSNPKALKYGSHPNLLSFGSNPRFSGSMSSADAIGGAAAGDWKVVSAARAPGAVPAEEDFAHVAGAAAARRAAAAAAAARAGHQHPAPPAALSRAQSEEQGAGGPVPSVVLLLQRPQLQEAVAHMLGCPPPGSPGVSVSALTDPQSALLDFMLQQSVGGAAGVRLCDFLLLTSAVQAGGRAGSAAAAAVAAGGAPSSVVAVAEVSLVLELIGEVR